MNDYILGLCAVCLFYFILHKISITLFPIQWLVKFGLRTDLQQLFFTEHEQSEYGFMTNPKAVSGKSKRTLHNKKHYI